VKNENQCTIKKYKSHFQFCFLIESDTLVYFFIKERSTLTTLKPPTLNKNKQACLCTHLNGAFNFQLNKINN